MTVAEVATEQEQAMGHRKLLLAPFGDQPRGQRMAKVMKSRIRAIAIGNEVPGEAAKCIVYGILV